VDKLRKAFVLLLGSDKPGEMAAARDAVLRLARSEQCGLHELATALIVGLKRVKDIGVRARKECTSHAEMAARILDWAECGGHLSEREHEFVQDMAEWGGQPSEKQMAWLRKIYRRTGH
jgi:hypothetical protein